MSDAYYEAVKGQIEWYRIRIDDLEKDDIHLKECKMELEGRIS